MMKNMKRVLLVTFVLLLAMTMLVACGGGGSTPATTPDAADTAEALAIGQGDTTFRFEMVDPDEVLHLWEVSTDEETVGAALLAVGLIAGDESEWGLMVTVVNGIEADFEADGAFWGFFIDGDFAMQGVDATYIEEGVVYALIYTVG